MDDELEPDAATKVRELVVAAAGISPERGDQVTVESMAIDALKLAEEQDKLAEAADADRAKSRSLQNALRYGSFLLMAAMVAAAMMMLSRRLSALPEPVARAAEPAAEGAEAAQATQAVAPAANAPPPAAADAQIPPMDVNQLRQSIEAPEERELATELSSLGAETPDDFARQLRGWIGNGTGSGD